MGRVLVLGSLNVDLVARVERLPRPGETVSAIAPIQRLAGGKGGNQALAAATAGARVVMIGAVGDDEPGRAYTVRLSGRGVFPRLAIAFGVPTGTAYVWVDETGENAIVVAPGANADAAIDVEAIERIVADVKREGRYFLLSHEARAIMTLAGVAIPESLTAQNLDSAVRSAEKIGYPVVMKIISRDIIHKSDAGGIALDLDNAGEVMDAYGAILRNCRANVPQAVLEGVALRTAEVVSAMESLGPVGDTISIDGGMAKNTYFCQFLANALNKRIEVASTTELTALGTARMAMRGAGLKSLPPLPEPRASIKPDAPLGRELKQRFSEAVKRAKNWK